MRPSAGPATFTGTMRLTRLALRRDRVQLPVWLLGLTAVTGTVASSVLGLYGSEEEQAAYARSSALSAVSRVFNGVVPEPGLGAIVVAESYGLVAVLAALMSIMAVVRHTRQSEETGRAEMIGSMVVGRHAMLTAALLVAVGANAVLAVLVAAVLPAAGLPAAGSLLLGVAIGASGAAFAGVAAVAAQITESARAANGIAAAVLGLAFLLRGLGDGFGTAGADGLRVTSLWPSWLSPLGWGQRTEPFTADRPWPLLLHTALLIVLAGTAYRLTDHRDVGTGMLPVRRGPATAPRALLSPLGLAWRLQRGVLYGWTAALLVVGGMLGALGDQAEELLGTSDELAEAMARLGGTGDPVDVYFAAMMGFTGVLVAGYTVQALLRMRAEETGPLEAVLATAVSRPRWMAAHITCAVLGTAAVLAGTGLANGLAYAVAAGSADRVPALLGAALVQLPATLALAGFVVAVIGLLPRWSVAISWTALAGCLLIGQIGPLLELPRWAADLSPFGHTPALPSADLTVTPLAALIACAVALGAAGLTAFRRRDLSLSA
ncbi:anibiotic ABC transporter [Actinomadura sp. GC306]|uniref:ABC transporter permease n=1 Tax=Actinomadura sp. GC306 TaxID=2530367 RepID=UPI00104BF0DB|nr:anibiotic ABC transporter [Actinomadura sp. GC306]TDC70217.1 anibiotic ABC transporter [Actinomadura sp. GC306]